LLSIKETAEFVKIPINGLSTSQRKIDKEPDEIVRMLRALRNANLFLQNQREISAGLVTSDHRLLQCRGAFQGHAGAPECQEAVRLRERSE
jgi:hypothetical protein